MRAKRLLSGRTWLLSLLACWTNATAGAQVNLDVFDGIAKADVLLLGTFHFDDPGLDDYKPEFPWNPLDPHNSRQIAEVVQLLVRSRPSRIAVEWPVARQAALDSAYSAWVSGRAPLGPSEREQLAFRLARALGHERVYAIDAPARSYFPDLTQEQYDRHVAQLTQGADPRLLARQQDLERRYRALARLEDSLKTTMSLRDYFLRENAANRVLAGHGQYLVGSFHLGQDDDYLGPDMRTRWYNRNLRIFHNLQRITRSADERILVIIGAGHLPILRHSVEASPEYRLVEVQEYLRRQ